MEKQLENPRTAILLHSGKKDRVQVVHMLSRYRLMRNSFVPRAGLEQLNAQIKRLEFLLDRGV